MTKLKHKKAKFKVGQIIYSRNSGNYFEITAYRFNKKKGCYQYLALWTQHDESSLRRLNKRERGE